MKAAASFLLLLCFLAVSQGWNCREVRGLSNIQQIDAGAGQVVAVDKYRRVYQLSGSSWYRLGTCSLKHVSVGPSGTWGTDNLNRVYKLVAGNFQLASGLTMLQLDAGGHGQVVGIRAGNNHTYCLRERYTLDYVGVSTTGWRSLSKAMRYCSCGPMYGCWAVDQHYRVYITKSMSPSTCEISGWRRVPGPAMTKIEVASNGYVFGLSTGGKVYQRTGITSSLQEGNGWSLVSISMTVQHVTYDLYHLWIVTSGSVMECSQ